MKKNGELPTDTPLVRTACGNLGALRKVTLSKEHVQPKEVMPILKNMKSSQQIVDLLDNLPYAIVVPEHVRGHQDDTSRDLTCVKLLKVRMDALAKEFTLAYIRQGTQSSKVESQ